MTRFCMVTKVDEAKLFTVSTTSQHSRRRGAPAPKKMWNPSGVLILLLQSLTYSVTELEAVASESG